MTNLSLSRKCYELFYEKRLLSILLVKKVLSMAAAIPRITFSIYSIFQRSHSKAFWNHYISIIIFNFVQEKSCQTLPKSLKYTFM